MSSIREAVRRLLGRAQEESAGGRPRPIHSYTIFWTKEVRAWTPEHRKEVRANVEATTSRPGFEATTYERRYRVDGLDNSAHAGASLLALLHVLEGFEQFGEQAEESEQ